MICTDQQGQPANHGENREKAKPNWVKITRIQH